MNTETFARTNYSILVWFVILQIYKFTYLVEVNDIYCLQTILARHLYELET